MTTWSPREHLLVTEGLGVNHLRLVMGTSMGCMHSFVWGETYPDFMDALDATGLPAGADRGPQPHWRKMVMDAIRNDPEWKGGEYMAEPQQALRTALDLLLIAEARRSTCRRTLPTRDAADKYLDNYFKARFPSWTPTISCTPSNASRNYDPVTEPRENHRALSCGSTPRTTSSIRLNWASPNAKSSE